MKRHPTLEDDVTIYGGAIILGGQTTIGQGATIGGSVFITQSIPPGHMVTMSPPDLKLKPPAPPPEAQDRRKRIHPHHGLCYRLSDMILVP